MTEGQRERERHATREYPRKSEGGRERERQGGNKGERDMQHTSIQGRVRGERESDNDGEALRERGTCNKRVSRVRGGERVTETERQ